MDIIQHNVVEVQLSQSKISKESEAFVLYVRVKDEDGELHTIKLFNQTNRIPIVVDG